MPATPALRQRWAVSVPCCCVITAEIYVDGFVKKMTAYNINGNNFFKLRDIMQVFDVYVG